MESLIQRRQHIKDMTHAPFVRDFNDSVGRRDSERERRRGTEGGEASERGEGLSLREERD